MERNFQGLERWLCELGSWSCEPEDLCLVISHNRIKTLSHFGRSRMEDKFPEILPFRFRVTCPSHAALDSNYSVWALKMPPDNIIQLARNSSRKSKGTGTYTKRATNRQRSSSSLDITASTLTQGTPHFTAFHFPQKNRRLEIPKP